MTSPFALVERAHQTWRLMVFLTNWTCPSAMVTFTPPGWLLVEGTVQAESVLQLTLQL